MEEKKEKKEEEKDRRIVKKIERLCFAKGIEGGKWCPEKQPSKGR